MDGFEAARARTFIYMAHAMIDELGEERGKQLIHDTILRMSKDSGESTRILYEKKGVKTSWENHRAENGPIYSVAWIGGIILNEPSKKVIEYTYCPLGEAFSRMGKDAEVLGDIYCGVTDNAFWSGFNPVWQVTREKTFSKDGICRLVWKKGIIE